MKKYLFGALALPLLFACSSEDFDEKVVSNDKFAGIAKVDATFSMYEGAMTRMHSEWAVEYGDNFGFAWMGGGTANPLAINGNAYQNHPLTVVNDATRGKIFKPQTSIYVGKYYLYYPYDYSTVDIDKIKFNSLVNQPLADGANETWKSVAKNAILIGDKWTDVKVGGTTVSGKVWDEPGIDKPFQIFSAFFSNQTALDLTYKKNNEVFDGKKIVGATDIDYTYPTGSTIGAADIYKIEVTLPGATQSFEYGPTAEPNAGAHNGNYWETKSALAGGFNFTGGAAKVTLTPPATAENGISTNKANNKGWFWFNSLPVDAGSATSALIPVVELETSYGKVTINDKTLADCAWAYEDLAQTTTNHEINGDNWTPEWIKLDAADAAKTASTPTKWDPTLHNTFINQYGNHKGKYALDVDFSKGVMNGMHIVNDAHLQKALKYYIAAGKTETGVVLNLDGASASDKTFKLSKISIALLQTINKTATKVLVQACTSHNNPVKIIVTQDGQDALGLAAATDVPALDKVFAAATDVYLSKDYTWTWSDKIKNGSPAVVGKLTIDANVNSITNEGTLNVTAQNIQLNIATVAGPPAQYTLANAADATMNITKVTTVKNALTNLGTINVGAEDNTAAELRAYDVEIKNDANELLTPNEIINGEITGNKEIGRINNYGVVGVSDVGTSGEFNNYGLIDVKNAGAITLLTTNQKVTNFDNAFDNGILIPANENKMGTVKLPSPTALVSVANTAANGFIAYNWTGTPYATPAGNVKFNTIVVSGDIEFTVAEPEIKYIIFNGTRTQVINNGYLINLKGVIVNAGKSIIIEKGNTLAPTDGTFLGDGATVYKGGIFTHNASLAGTTASNYFGTWLTTQIVKY